MTLEELGSKLQEVDDACRLAQTELEVLTRRQEGDADYGGIDHSDERSEAQQKQRQTLTSTHFRPHCRE
jgi:hypothetical protein